MRGCAWADERWGYIRITSIIGMGEFGLGTRGVYLYNAKYDFVSTRPESPPRLILHYTVCKRADTRRYDFSPTKQRAMERPSLGWGFANNYTIPQ